MTLRLILIRHAKSSWSDPTTDDHDRVLNSRGRESAKAIGAWLGGKGFVPQKVICSSAARCAETLALVQDGLAAKPEVMFEQSLYNASLDVMLGKLQSASGDVVAMIGHNPAIGELADALVKQSPARPRFSIYPSGATTVIDFDVESWSEVQLDQGDLVDFVLPRDLLR